MTRPDGPRFDRLPWWAVLILLVVVVGQAGTLIWLLVRP